MLSSGCDLLGCEVMPSGEVGDSYRELIPIPIAVPIPIFHRS